MDKGEWGREGETLLSFAMLLQAQFRKKKKRQSVCAARGPRLAGLG